MEIYKCYKLLAKDGFFTFVYMRNNNLCFRGLLNVHTAAIAAVQSGNRGLGFKSPPELKPLSEAFSVILCGSWPALSQS